MQKYNNIKAILFFVLFSMFLLHQSVPHFHHEHDEVAVNVIEHSHDHDHDQNHNDIPEKKEGSFKSVLDLFLGTHVHGTIKDENLLARKLTLHQKVVKKAVSDLFSLNSYIVIKDIKEFGKPTIYRPPEDYFNIYTSYLDLRGPPSLG